MSKQNEPEIITEGTTKERIKKLIQLAEKNKFDLTPASALPKISYLNSGLPQIDAHGFAMYGKYSVLFGPNGAGKTTLLLQTAAKAQQEDKVVLYVDAEHRLDRDWAERQGVNLDELLVIDNEPTMESYLDRVRFFVRSGLCNIVVIDTISAMTPAAMFGKAVENNNQMEKDFVALDARKIQQFIKLTKYEFYKHNVACIIIGQVRDHGIGSLYVKPGLSGGHMLKHMASRIWLVTALSGDAETEKKLVIIDGNPPHKVNLAVSWNVKISMIKGPMMGMAAWAKFRLGVGFDIAGSWINAALAFGLFETPSKMILTWKKSDGEEIRMRGRNNAEKYFRENEDSLKELMEQVKAATEEEKVASLLLSEDEDATAETDSQEGGGEEEVVEGEPEE